MKLFEFPDLNSPKNIAVSPYEGCCIVAETGNGRVLRISPEGELISEIGDYFYPRGLFIEYRNDN